VNSPHLSSLAKTRMRSRQTSSHTRVDSGVSVGANGRAPHSGTHRPRCGELGRLAPPLQASRLPIERGGGAQNSTIFATLTNRASLESSRSWPRASTRPNTTSHLPFGTRMTS
jgi:hypothetical protein